MIREIFTFDSKDYEKFAIVEFSFLVAENNIENFLKETKLFKNKKGNLGYVISKLHNGVLSNKVRNFKEISVKLYAFHLAKVLETLGVHRDSQVYSPFGVFRNSFEKTRKHRFFKPSYEFLAFNPKRKEKWKILNNTPVIINGNQIVHCGTVYRRYKV